MPDPDVRRGRSVVSNLHVHLIFTAKYRKAVFTDELLAGCENTMREVCTDFGATLSEFNGETDHVHLLVHYPPHVRLSDLVDSLKGVSSRVLRRDYPAQIRPLLWGDHLWSPSYFAGSCGGAPLSIVKDYIENQKRPS
ncbi:MAG: IS200/IS605 family transposase [Cutibacterium avidum]|nr:IS200/IS605 family transposase [Cutibacterium avidum]MDU7718356.1 IS200/IS605 family transposase [Cutibacterium avidum]